MSADLRFMSHVRSQRGGIYVAVLGVSLLVMTLGLGGLMAVRASAGSARDIQNTLRVQAASVAAVELARLAVANDAAWRSTFTSGTWSPALTFGTATIRWRLIDPSDGDLADDASEPVTVEGLATLADCTRVTAVSMQVRKQALTALASTIHAAGSLENSGILATSGRGISTAGTLTNNGVVRGDASALLTLGSGNITGSSTILSLAPTMPSSSVFDGYKARATAITWGGGAGDWTVTWPLLSAGVNPSGSGTNADGIYTISVPAARVLTLELYRIRGTLVIECGDKASIQITKATTWEPHRVDLPVLLIRHTTATSVQDSISPAVGTLSEAALGVNLNPPGSPADGVENTSQTDSYPSRINGLVHVIFPAGNLGGSSTLIGGNASIRGIVLCTGTVIVPSTGASVTFDEALFANPPDGYYTGSMQIIPGTWTQVAAP